MKRESYKPIGDLLADFIKDEKLEDGLLRVKIFRTWDIVVGESYAKATIGKFYKDKILYCTISSSTVRSQMYFQKRFFIGQINKALNGDYISEIVLK